MAATNARSVLYRDATRAAWLGLVVNALLGSAKLAGGLVSGSFALIADAVNSLGDVFTSIVVLFAFHFAQRPPDAEHPYGHTRAEAIAASNVALLVMLSALGIAWEAIQRVGVAHEPPPVWTLWLAAVNVLVKEALYRYKISIGKRIGSSALVANAWDHRGDALCSLAVLVGLAAVRWGGPRWISADEIAALVVVFIILWSGVRLFSGSASELMDAQADEALVRQVRESAATTPDVRNVETLRLRKSGLEYFADIHIEVDRDLSVADGHEIGHRVKDRLLEQFPKLRDVLVHLEPFAGG